MPDSLTLFDIVPGKVLSERYTVVGPNRQGGFSKTFEVTDASDGSRCELQFFPAALFEGESQVGQFFEKLKPWKSVASKHVCRVREVLELDTDLFALVTDMPAGESLRERLNASGPLGRDEVLAIGVGLLRGLTQVHAQELVHGDVKPYTIHVEGKGADTRSILLDGGVTLGMWAAKDLGDKTTLIGTPYYAPIEQFGGDAPDVRSDVYNAATVLFECATGVLPWAGKTFLEVFQAKLADPPSMQERAPQANVDPDLEAAIRKGCLADRNKRYASSAAFLDALLTLG